MPLDKQFAVKEIAIFYNIISQIAVLSICLLKYILQFNRFLLLKQSNYNKDGQVNILGLVKIQKVLLNQYYNKFKGLLDTQLNQQAFIFICFSFTNSIPADYYTLKVNFKLGEYIKLTMLKQSSNWFLIILGL